MGWAIVVILLIAGAIALLVYVKSRENNAEPLSTRPQSPSPAQVETLAGEVVRLRDAIDSAKKDLAKYDAQQLERMKMLEVKQLHAQSHRQGTEWHRTLHQSVANRDRLSASLGSLKDYRRSLAARRDRSRGPRRQGIVAEIAGVSNSIDSLYAGIEQIGVNIRICRTNLDAYNIQTGEIRDYLNGRYGKGWRNRDRGFGH